MNIAIITAAGNGTRMHSNVPKQFLSINDKPVIVYTLEAFQKHPEIDKIIISCAEGWEAAMQAYSKQYGISKLAGIVKGGETNQLSIYNCLKYLQNICSSDDIVIVHDGVRPIVLPEVISSSISVCKKYGNSVAVCPSNEAILKNLDDFSSNISIPRDSLKITQTPHSCYFEHLLKLHNEAIKNGITSSVATCTLIIEMGEKVFYSLGSKYNTKVTTQEDFEIVKTLICNLGIK